MVLDGFSLIPLGKDLVKPKEGLGMVLGEQQEKTPRRPKERPIFIYFP